MTRSEISRLIAKRNILKNKKSSIALVITLSLIFSILIILIGIKDIYANVFEKEAISKYPNIDIVISYDEYSPTRFINKRDLIDSYEEIDYVLSFFNLQVLNEVNGKYQYASLFSSQKHEFELFVDQDIDVSPYGTVITETYAEENNLILGDDIHFSILGKTFDYTVEMIIPEVGIFDERGFFVEKDVLLDDLYGLSYSTNLGNVVYVKTSNVDYVHERLNQDANYSDYKVSLVVDQELITRLVNEFTPLVIVAGIIVLIALVIVLNSLFQMILKDAFQEMAIFDMLGDNNHLGRKVLFYQWVYYVSTSLFIGIIIAQFVIYSATLIYGINEIIFVNFYTILVSILSLSTYIIIKNAILLKRYQKYHTTHKLKQVISLDNKSSIYIIILLSLFLLGVFIKPFSIEVNALIISLSSLGMMLYLLAILLQLFSKYIFRKESTFGLIHIRGMYKNTYIYDTVKVVSISFIVIAILLTVRMFMANEIETQRKEYYLDLMVVNLHDYDDEVLADIRRLDVEKADSALLYNDIEIKVDNESILLRNFVSTRTEVYDSYFGYPLDLVELEYQNHQFPYILLPQTYEAVYELDKGDVVLLTLSPKLENVSFVVGGFIRSNYDHFAFSNLHENLDEFNLEYNSIFIKAAQSSSVMNELILTYSSNMYYVVDAKNLINSQLNLASNVLTLFTVITGFIVFSFLFVIYNNTILKFQSQKNDYAKILVLGINKKTMRINHLKEWISVIVVIGLLGSLEVYILSGYLKHTLLFFGYYKEINTNMQIIMLSYIITSIILMASYITNYKFIYKMNIIDEIKTY